MKNFILFTYAFFSFGFAAMAQSLNDYFAIAAENNPGLQAKYKIFEASLQRASQVSSLPDPTLSFGYFISPVETRVGPQKAKFSLTQMFPWFGTLKAQGEAVSLLAEAKYQAFLDERNKLYYRVSAAYYPLYELEKWIAIEQNNVAILDRYKNIATVKFQNGKSTMVDVLRVDMMLSDAKSNLTVLEQKKKPLLTRFNNLLNRDNTAPVKIVDNLVTVDLQLDYRKDSLLTSNPTLEEIDLKIQASEASILATKRQGLPKVGVGVDYVIVGERTDMDVSDNGQDVFMPMVSVSLPIFRGKYKAATKEAQLMQESFSLQKQEVANQLTSSYEMVWFEIQKQWEFVALYQNQIKEAEQSLDLLYTAYSNSGKDFEEVLRMQRIVLKYQKLKATAVAEHHMALAQLDYITAKTK